MALTKIGKEGITGISNASDATFLTATSGEGVTLAGTLAVTGVHTIGTNAVATSDGGAATTSIVQGLCKWWITLDGVGTVEARDSFNNSGITDVGTGKYTFSFSNSLANLNYQVSTSGSAATANNYGFQAFVKTSDGIATGSLQIWNANPSNLGAYTDADYLYATIHGDLA